MSDDTSRLLASRRIIWAGRVCLVTGVLMTAFAISEFFHYSRSNETLSRVDGDILGSGDLPAAMMVSRIQDALRDRLRPWPPGEAGKRPFLRDPAEDIWTMRTGKCGDGTRLMIQLLSMRGVTARRVVLYNAEWNAVNAGFEYLDGARWIYEGAFNSVPGETDYTRAHPAGIEETIHGDNPISRHYKRFSYLNLARLGIRRVVTHPLPAWLGWFLETPSLIRLVATSIGSLACLWFWFTLAR